MNGYELCVVCGAPCPLCDAPVKVAGNGDHVCTEQCGGYYSIELVTFLNYLHADYGYRLDPAVAVFVLIAMVYANGGDERAVSMWQDVLHRMAKDVGY